ncbi:hypothetical protein MA16_Dca013591 [Dendrobium catenatum]|uniref:Uncharacterized protein n=1 Tax=Dendrobium catenatum TaxID=906689 RepID=A0A2I0VUS7_9ASPA|nr:hypothetical protein MA16_Dca013591 [Dendrobium catenatum]
MSPRAFTLYRAARRPDPGLLCSRIAQYLLGIARYYSVLFGNNEKYRYVKTNTEQYQAIPSNTE